MNPHWIERPAHITGEYRIPCPECGPTHGSSSSKCLAVNPDGLFICFRCGLKGNTHDGETRGPLEHPARARLEAEEQRRTKFANNHYWLDRTLGATVALAHPLADPVRQYLERRGLGEITEYPSVLRCHPSLERYDGQSRGRWPCLVALIQGPDGDRAGLHVTYLREDGTKAFGRDSRRFLNCVQPLNGTAIRLYAPTNELALTEGIETALAVYLSTGLAVWSCRDAGGLETAVIPESVTTVTICADNDSHGVGEQVARVLAARARANGLKACVAMPDRLGDWLDVLNEGAA